MNRRESLLAFAAQTPQPVVGIMIRTRIGFEVYGTNTELEKLAPGPVTAGRPRPDGVWHD